MENKFANKKLHNNFVLTYFSANSHANSLKIAARDRTQLCLSHKQIKLEYYFQKDG